MLTRRIFLRLLTAGAAVGATGCFGSFAATNWALDFNRSLSNSKFVRWLVFLVMVIIPVYEVAILIDVWVLNSIEFWFGGGGASENDVDEKIVQIDEDQTLLMRKDREAGVLYTTLHRRGKEPVELVFEMSEDGARVRGRSGVLAAVRSTRDGGVEVWAGGSVERFSPGRVEELDERFQRDGADGVAAWAAAHHIVNEDAA